jgi:hypothetical protein
MRNIQTLLRRNKNKFDAERLKEWYERKEMRTEDEVLLSKSMKENSKHEQDRIYDETKEVRVMQIDERWKKYVIESERAKNLEI